MMEDEVAQRLVDAFQCLGGADSGFSRLYWPRFIHRLEEYRARAQFHDWTGEDYSRAEEAFEWIRSHLADMPMEADALTVWAFATAFEIEVSVLMRRRREDARPLAKEIADRRNLEREELLLAEKRSVSAWASNQYRSRRIGHIHDYDERTSAADRLNTDARKRYDRILRRNPRIRATPSLAMPNRVLDQGQLERLRQEALTILTERLSRPSLLGASR